AAGVLARHGADARELDTVYVVVGSGSEGESLLARSEAVIFILRNLGAAELRSARPGQRPGPRQARTKSEIGFGHGYRFWRSLGWLLQLVPRRVRDWGYGVVARNRYRIFGRYDSCPVPSAETRGRFLS